tara:strand:- start:1456 stop:3327 length:1872 start_codon:yes stop_codon:yes gene_type:complete
MKSRRSDIDSLRAISVISVIIFHIDKLIFPYGYLGVDIFFVISGYVITISIVESFKKGNFSFSQFYFRRARRILPNLLFIILITTIFASIILLTADLKRFSESMVSALGFVSNFYFWLTGGYFSTNDELKPLLHLWSLSVEEQFYLFFPIFLFFLYKIYNKPKYYLIGIIIVSIISFYLNLYFLPNRDTVFFLFPTRIWQFGIGAALAISPSIKIKNLYLDYLYLIFALTLISYNFIYLIDFLPDASLMCIGIGLILIREFNQKNLLSKIFQIKPIIFIGLISYSLYLWHWPIISFLKYIYIDGAPFLIIALGLILIFSLSFLSWKFIEQPFMYKYSKKGSRNFILVNFFLLLIISVIILFSNNLPSRYEKFPNILAQSIKSSYDCPPIKYRKFHSTYGCYINTEDKKMPKNILLGNSHAFMYGWPFIKFLKDNEESGIILQTSCLPFVDKNISQRCLEKAKTRFNSIINSNNEEKIFIGFTWYSRYLIDDEGNTYFDKDFKQRKRSIDFLISELKKYKKNIVLIGPIPKPNYDFASEYSRQIIFEGNKYKLSEERKVFDSQYKDIIKYYENKLGKNFMQPHKKLCDKQKCYYADKNGALFSDGNHLSKYGSMKMLSLFHEIK